MQKFVISIIGNVRWSWKICCRAAMECMCYMLLCALSNLWSNQISNSAVVVKKCAMLLVANLLWIQAWILDGRKKTNILCKSVLVSEHDTWLQWILIIIIRHVFFLMNFDFVNKGNSIMFDTHLIVYRFYVHPQNHTSRFIVHNQKES